ncbi:sigma-54-dependent transcriptional regulator [Rhizobium halophytocola]|uniref:DNA-binding transcriptional regulator NtrC n=1 Tax=Rhizobium halophytocola TaxID=735519 RepID=A0ABS4DT89_9HYPH|nr:DNA-binding NtrC family response regulator [Rhizobium halophytocola]
MTAHILVVNSDPAQRRQIKSLVETQGHVVHAAENAASAFEKMVSLGSDLRVALLDLTMSGLDVNHFLSLANQSEGDAAVVVLADDGKVEAAVDAMRHGAFDFIVSPAAPERIAHAVSNALRVNERRAARLSRSRRTSQISFGEIVAVSGAMTRVVDLARRSASSAIPVILEGENGVGKQMVARAIHGAGDRSGKPFVAVSCGAMTPESLDAMLFGEEGGADEHGAGKIASAHGGTLFLDEVDALPLDVQARLLQLVQGGEISSHDGRRQRKVDVRLTSSTRKDLIEEVKAGRFREDLYFRMNVFPIMIPALRRRRDDIPYLARAFVERFSAEQRRAHPLGISADVLALLTSYDWPGNVRQLENAVYRAVILASGSELTEADFPQIAIQVAKNAGTDRHAAAQEPAAHRSFNRDAEEKAAAGSAMGLSHRDSERLVAAAQNPAVLSDNYIVSVDSAGNVRKLSEIEEELIRFALKYYRGQMSQVARKLGIGRSTLYRKLKDYGIDPDNPQSDVA